MRHVTIIAALAACASVQAGPRGDGRLLRLLASAVGLGQRLYVIVSAFPRVFGRCWPIDRFFPRENRPPEGGSSLRW